MTPLICLRSNAVVESALPSRSLRRFAQLHRRMHQLTRGRCWNGKDLDSPNHKEHVAYPSSGSFESGGPCPSTHPVKLPQLMYEVMWDTTVFNDKNLWPTDGSQPFVYSMGDGYVLNKQLIYSLLTVQVRLRATWRLRLRLERWSSAKSTGCSLQWEQLQDDQNTGFVRFHQVLRGTGSQRTR
jgi:hypothetical protein